MRGTPGCHQDETALRIWVADPEITTPTKEPTSCFIASELPLDHFVGDGVEGMEHEVVPFD